MLPIVNENDTISVTELMFTDNDELSGLVAAMMNAEALIILSNIDGIYDGSPADPASQVIRRVKPSEDLSQYIDPVRSSRGRGGMATKSRVSSRAAAEGIEVIIAGAGGAAHLPGMVASMTPLPVVGVPVKSRALNGLDSLLSIVQMPAGVPVATVAINGAKNAALIAVSILALSDGEVAARLDAFRTRQTADVLKAEL